MLFRSKDAFREYGVKLSELENAKNADCIIVAVAHNEFKKMSLDEIKALFRDCPDNEKVLLDVKGLYSVSDLKKSGMNYWRL